MCCQCFQNFDRLFGLGVRISIAALYHSWSNALNFKSNSHTVKNSTLIPVPECVLIAVRLDKNLYVFGEPSTD